jgi:PhnB protein
MANRPRIVPHLICKGALRAIAFYVDVLGAREVSRFVDRQLGDGDFVVHAELELGGALFSVAEEHREWHNHAPTSLGGSPVVLTLEVDDAFAVGKRLEAAGARVVFPIEDRFYGMRQGRLADPFGHLWIITQTIEELSAEEIQRRVDRFHD